MSELSRTSSISLLLLIISFVALTTVRSADNSFILPSDDDVNSVCGKSVYQPSKGSCPIQCFRADPVCGVDNVTYWCGCPDALCAGTRVAHSGACEVENGGSGPASGQALQLVQIVRAYFTRFLRIIRPALI